MTVRTLTTTLTFRRPFALSGLDEVLPAGIYRVETDEERLEGVSFPAYRRILTVIHLHEEAGRPGVARSLTVDPIELEEAVARDAAEAGPPKTHVE